MTLALSARDIPADVKQDLIRFGNNAVTQSTWSTYKTAQKLLVMCCELHRMPLTLPVPEDTILVFIRWLAVTRGLRSGTISGYLAGIRQWHIASGLPNPNFRSDLVNLILKGIHNSTNRLDRAEGRATRQPVTRDLMLLIRSRLRSWEAGAEARLLIWAVCCIALKGAFRSAELLARTGSFFDPAFTLLAEDVAVVQATNGEGERVKALQVLVKAPKEDKVGRATIVDVYESRDGCCPVRAFQKWANKASHREPGLPLFRLPDGTPLTSRKWNTVLRDRLKNFVPNPEVFSSHSFRSGAATWLAQLGYSDSEIKAVGRWSSRCFEDYIKAPRSKRSAVARRFSGGS